MNERDARALEKALLECILRRQGIRRTYKNRATEALPQTWLVTPM